MVLNKKLQDEKYFRGVFNIFFRFSANFLIGRHRETKMQCSEIFLVCATYFDALGKNS